MNPHQPKCRRCHVPFHSVRFCPTCWCATEKCVHLCTHAKITTKPIFICFKTYQITFTYIYLCIYLARQHASFTEVRCLHAAHRETHMGEALWGKFSPREASHQKQHSDTSSLHAVSPRRHSAPGALPRCHLQVRHLV